MRTEARRLRDATRTMKVAETYAAWLEAAEQVERILGIDAWRASDESDFLDAALLREHIAVLRRLRQSGAAEEVAAFLDESVHRHSGDLSASELYATPSGEPKHLVVAYLDAVAETLHHLAATEATELPQAALVRHFQRAATAYGRSALLLSGGATLGWYHLGVVRALHRSGLLPRVVSGSSMGAMIAAGICTRTETELDELFDDLSAVALHGLSPLPLREMLQHGAVLDPQVLHDTIRANCGDWTFAEAHARSHRVLNIHVSPVRSRQKPRLLNHLTAPSLLVSHSALASSSIPGMFPAATLARRTSDGTIAPYLPDERWIDGSMHGDVPKRRLGRHLNVNHFIVSQTNPHIVPLARARSASGMLPFTVTLTARSTRSALAGTLDVARQLSFATPLARWLDIAHSLTAQDYSGDIDIHPTFEPRMFRRVIANADTHDLRRFVLGGERSTWPVLARIRDQTRLSRLFDHILAALGSQ